MNTDTTKTTAVTVILMACAYCEADIPYGDLESRYGKMVCKDIAACDTRDAANHAGDDDE
jgi:hypothetical protein